MKNFIAHELRPRWLLLLVVFLLGLTAGIIVAQIWVYYTAGIWLLVVALIVSGLCAGSAGWLLGARNKRAEPGEPAPGAARPRVQLLRNNGKWVVRTHDLLGRESLEFTFTLGLNQAGTLGLILGASALGIYAITRFVALDQFPIFFFTDEAIHPVLGTELVARGIRDGQGHLFPAYFQNGSYWNLSLSVYLHALTAVLFGKSIVVTRATSALASLFGAAAVGCILKWFFKVRTWWLGVLLLAVTPAWFLHSRTAFETVLMVSAYSIFLLFYLLYRYRSPRFLFPALLFAAATFYSYSNGQVIIGLAGILFLLSDLPYHLKQWRAGLMGIGVLLVLAIPYLAFRANQPNSIAYHLQILDSYWITPGPVADKVQQFISTYLYGLSPQYWFLPNEQDLIRHRMKDYGNIGLWVLPFFALGLAIALRYVKRSEYRALLITLLVAPFGSALADIAITRALLFVVPVAILATLGINTVIHWIRSPRVQTVAVATAFVVPAMLSFAMLGDALTNGPTWYSNYGLYGMQWGAQQLFAHEIPQLVKDHPGVPIYVTPTWANGSDVFLRFFDVDPRVTANSVDSWMANKLPLDQQAIFIMAPEEFDKARSSPKFKNVELDHTIQYPDGRNGFFIAHMAYTDTIDTIMAAEREAMLAPVTDTVTIDGQAVLVTHTRFDIGDANAIFDGLRYTLARGVEANPLLLDIKFPTPRAIHGLTGYFGNSDIQVTARLKANDSAQPVEYESEFKYAAAPIDLPEGPPAQMNFDHGPGTITHISLTLALPESDDTAHVHVFDLTFH